VLKYGVAPIVAVNRYLIKIFLFFFNFDFNRFSSDTERELQLVCELAKAAGAIDAVVANHWAEGGAGAIDLGRAVIRACEESRTQSTPQFRFVFIVLPAYPLHIPQISISAKYFY
jgi:formyltetrahydrofolate synthetase